jgi:hypothetical protein
MVNASSISRQANQEDISNPKVRKPDEVAGLAAERMVSQLTHTAIGYATAVASKDFEKSLEFSLMDSLEMVFKLRDDINSLEISDVQYIQSAAELAGKILLALNLLDQSPEQLVQHFEQWEERERRQAVTEEQDSAIREIHEIHAQYRNKMYQSPEFLLFMRESVEERDKLKNKHFSDLIKQWSGIYRSKKETKEK